MSNYAYIHIPFCTQICSYCDFCKIYYNEKIVGNYLKSLEKEIKQKYKGEKLKTIYIGGGTPSSLSIEHLIKLFDILKIFKLNKNYEFTFECNINDITEEKLALLYNNKVNRLSIGVQSFNQNNLKMLNRKHNKQDILDKIVLIKKMGFNNINVDLMYAIPGQTLSSLEEDIDIFLKLDINHISTYSLILEDHTYLTINNIKPISEDLEYNMYELICKKLKKNGFKHYEISNFAKKGFESKHNLNYWNNNSYYGFGLGATAYLNNIRYTNTRSIKHYIDGKYVLDKEIISQKEQMSNEMILGLRKLKGVNKKTFFEKYGKMIEEAFDIKDLLNQKYLIDNGKNIYINKKYLYVENSILIKFLGG